MGATGKLRSDQCRFRFKYAGIHILQRLSAQIIIAISRRGLKAARTDLMLLHCPEYFHLIVFRRPVDLLKPLLQSRFDAAAEIINLFTDPCFPVPIL